MNTHPKSIFHRCLAVLFLPAILAAQVAPAPATDTATLARYDRNQNGRLDSDELRAMEADRKMDIPVTSPAGDAEAVVMSPFEVVADNKGYYATNTMSGTRLNSKLEDLASSISVVTKEQMADFAMLDINDVFLYSGSTEGTGTYTEFEVESGGGRVTDTVSGDPINANRVRGIGSANVSNGNFETSNRVPIDPLDADGVEISRGPNANIFGLGNASGTVNIIGASANLRRNRSQVAFRADSFEGHRGSIDLNRVLLKNRLSVRFSAVRQHDGFNLKPSGVDTSRYNAMVQFRPFKRTTIKATYQHYRAHGNRPNSLPPLDAITDWRNAGAPTWDPLTNSRYIDGVLVGTGNPAYLYNPGAARQHFIDRDGLKLVMSSIGVSGDVPNSAVQNTRKLVITRGLVNDAQPLIGRRLKMVSDKSVYDWSSINLAAPNRFDDGTATSRVTLDQAVFDTRRQSLAVQLGWFHEDSQRNTRYRIGDGAAGGLTGQLAMDVNERLLDGTPNPFFMRPLLALNGLEYKQMPLRNDTYRGQLAYKLDFTEEQGIRRWLGRHSLVGYGEYKERVQRRFRFRHAVVSDNPWVFNADGNRIGFGPSAGGQNRFYVGGNQGGNIDYEPGNYGDGTYDFIWGDAISGVMHTEPIEIGDLAFIGGSSGSRTIQKTGGAILQSALLKGRIVATLGVRKDRHYTKFQNLTQLDDRKVDYDYDYVNRWRDGDWNLRDGRTETRGVVVKPFRDFAFLDRRAERGAGPARFLAGALRGLSVHYNRSDSFKPADPAKNVFDEWLPDPGGKGKDYGFALNLFDGKLVVRVNKYENRQTNSRSGISGTLAKRLWNMDYVSTAFNLQDEATAWITEAATAQGRTLSQAELEAELTRVMGVPPQDQAALNAIPVSETDDILSRGHEVEIHFNPTAHWTVNVNFTEQQTINTRMSPNASIYSAQRLPIWTTVVDPRANEGQGGLWWDTLYGGAETPAQSYRRNIENPLRTATATEGLARPQIRRYRGNLSTNFRLSGVTDHRLLRRFNVGGALRYESRGAIGYWGLQQKPAIITDYDYTRPIWDKSHLYVDGFIGYRTRLWKDKVGATFQLNVRNIQEGGRLQTIAVFPDGTPNSFRIVSPRQFIFSATFDL